MPFVGEAAAVTTALLWAGGSLLFTGAGRRIGTFPLNLARINLAFLVLAVLVLASGTPWREVLTPGRAGLLALSGILGLVLGDWALFTAYVRIGPRIASLLMSLSPPLAALVAVPLLGERLGAVAFLGMALTVAGIMWVVLERSPTPVPRGHRMLGVSLAFLGASGQAVGLVLSKVGMDGEVPPLTATAVRMGAAAVGVWVLGGLTGRLHQTKRLLHDPVARRFVLGATVVGPVLGVWLSLVAVRYTEAGVAATLMAPVPVFILPFVRIFHGERISPRAVIGAVVAVTGVAVLLLRGASG